MGFFYFDESIQKKGEFIIGAFVYSNADITPAVFSELAAAGLKPGIDEFKSGAQISARPELAKARQSLRSLLRHVGTGVVITPVADRQRLGKEALIGLAKILTANSLVNIPHQVFIDEGIIIDGPSLEGFRNGAGSWCEVHINQDSRAIGGIQLADLAAHSMGIMLLEHQGIVRKMVKAGENSGYDPDLDIELGFELWASLRYSFFKAPQPKPNAVSGDPVGDSVFDVENYGLHVADTCDISLRKSAIERFGECYLGCIH